MQNNPYFFWPGVYENTGLYELYYIFKRFKRCKLDLILGKGTLTGLGNCIPNFWEREQD